MKRKDGEYPFVEDGTYTLHPKHPWMTNVGFGGRGGERLVVRTRGPLRSMDG